MKVLLINGSSHKNGSTYTALEEISKELKKENVESEIYHIGNKPVRGCLGCGKCKTSEEHKCIFNDDPVNEMLRKQKMLMVLYLVHLFIMLRVTVH